MFLCHLLDNLCSFAFGSTSRTVLVLALAVALASVQLQVADVGRYRHQFRCCNAWSIGVVQTATRDVTLCLSRLWGVGQHTALQHHRNDV